MRASSVVNCQSTVASDSLRPLAHAVVSCCITCGSSPADHHRAPRRKRLEECEELRHAISVVAVVLAVGRAGLGLDRIANVPDKLTAHLIHAHYGPVRIVRSWLLGSRPQGAGENAAARL